MNTVNEEEIQPEEQEGYVSRVLVDSKLGCQSIEHYVAELNPGKRRNFSAAGEEVIYILGGNGKVVYDEQIFPVSAGSVIYCPKGLKFTLESTGQENMKIVGGISLGEYKNFPSARFSVHDRGSLEQRQLDVRTLTVLANGESMTVLSVEFPGNYQGSEDIHNSGEEVMYVLSGTGEISVREATEPLRPGTALFIPAMVKHCLVNKEPNPMILLAFLTPARNL